MYFLHDKLDEAGDAAVQNLALERLAQTIDCACNYADVGNIDGYQNQVSLLVPLAHWIRTSIEDRSEYVDNLLTQAKKHIDCVEFLHKTVTAHKRLATEILQKLKDIAGERS